MFTRRQFVFGAVAAATAGSAGLRFAGAADAPATADLDALTSAGAKLTQAGGAVTKLELRDCSKLAEADYARLGRLTGLKGLTLGRCTGLTEKTLPLLAGLTALEELSFEGSQISDEGMKHFAAFISLKSASFFHPSFGMKGYNGSGFANLKALTKLQKLTVAGSPFNDDGMAAIGQITQLQSFRTWHTYQTPAGTASLAKLPNLKDLRFGQRLRRYDGKPNTLTLDDAALDDLAKISTLELLYLDEANLTHGGLVKLKALTKLKELTLERIIVPAADIEKLKADLPKVKITVKPIEPADLDKLEKGLKA
ncbi:hypothetical protein [Humisphaera borealis]|uniref:Leucine-rich repeat domain-containing protein n=1 Tax=Humisphaera borealis TaxID=2807512 RepID=A0A7M2X3U3_9BACT|nr:hypothetical protein [Humisphaera borealis]QOV91691.1 hypothetical protein IPV69_10135 [Humisphaera borealis]